MAVQTLPNKHNHVSLLTTRFSECLLSMRIFCVQMVCNPCMVHQRFYMVSGPRAESEACV